MLQTRVLLVDDHRLLLDAIRNLIEPEFAVVGTFDDPQKALDAAPELKPDIILLDITMPGINGITAGDELKRLLPKTRLIFLTMNYDLDTAAEAFRLGAFGYVLKSAAGAELISALREVSRGGYYASAALTEGMTGSFVQAFKQMKRPHDLTPRQRAVLQLLSQGMSMKQVARALNITSRTVAFHKYTIMDHLNIRSNAELMNFALANLSEH